MATTTVIALRIERSLRALLDGLGDLHEVTAEWSTLSDAERASFSLNWDHLMADYLSELSGYARADAMTPDQQMRYIKLLRKLGTLAPTVEQLGLYLPPLPPRAEGQR